MKEIGTLHFMIGKMGAGKSTFSHAFAEEYGCVLISEDTWLSQLYPDEIHTFDDFLIRHKKLLKVLGPHVTSILRSGASVIMDFPANTVDSRRWFIDTATKAGAEYKAIYIQASDELCLRRIEKRTIEQPERAKFDTPEVFESVNRFFEEPTENEKLTVQVVQAN